MRAVLLLCVLAPVLAFGQEYVSEDAIGGIREMELLAWYAGAICVWMVAKSIKQRSLSAIYWSLALILTVVVPDLAAFVLFGAVTVLVVLLGISRGRRR